jgi:hypothetical protein
MTNCDFPGFANVWQNERKFAKHCHFAAAEASARSLPSVRWSRLKIRERPSSKGLGLPLILWQIHWPRAGCILPMFSKIK